MAAGTTVTGWVVVIGLFAAYGYYFVHGRRRNRNLRPVAPNRVPARIEPKREPKAKKARKDDGHSSGDQSEKTRARKKKAKQAKKAEREDQAVTTARADENEVVAEPEESKEHDMSDDKEFARQLHLKKTGTVAASKSQAASRPKSVKQTRAQERPIESNSDNATAPSSTTGGDADDDESPLNSPDLAATEVATPIANGDMSDMLEKPAPGPSVLKINAPTNPVQPKKAKTQAAVAPVEGKQQKKNRKKAQEAKAMKEQAEAERKEKLEKQLKTARVAEGRSAKDGSAFMAAQSPSSAWTASTTELSGNKAVTSGPKVELLDTYESSSSNVPLVKRPSEIFSQSEIAGSTVLSEEEAVAQAVAESAHWEVVKKSKDRKRSSKETKDTKENKLVDNPEKKTTHDDYVPTAETTSNAPGKPWAVETTAAIMDNGQNTVEEQQLVINDSEWIVA